MDVDSNVSYYPVTRMINGKTYTYKKKYIKKGTVGRNGGRKPDPYKVSKDAIRKHLTKMKPDQIEELISYFNNVLHLEIESSDSE